jgi:hypothetical protein
MTTLVSLTLLILLVAAATDGLVGRLSRRV